MQWLAQHFWTSLPIAILAGLALSVAGKSWMRRKGSTDNPLHHMGNTGCEARFEIVEAPGIRSLLGPQITDALLKQLAKRIDAAMILQKPPSIDTASISAAFIVTDEANAGQQMQAAMHLLSSNVSVSGIDFCCQVRGSILTKENMLLPGSQGSFEQGASLRIAMLQELTDAIADDLLTLEYQPKLDLRESAIHSTEALLRWRRNDGTLANTGELIELAEKTGIITELTLWTVKRAIADGEMMRQSGFGTKIFVNISGGLLADREFADKLLSAVAATDVPIGIEITETAVIADPEVAIRHLQSIADAGISIAIDDFGAGLSSLEYLQQLPAAELKIDRNFIATLSSSNRNPLIVKASIDLAHALEMKVTAEGVDDALSLSLLKVMGCDMVQGYLISPALPVVQLIEFMKIYQTALRRADLSEATTPPLVGTIN